MRTGQVLPILSAWFSLLGCPPATPRFPWRGKKLLNIWHTAVAEALLVLSTTEGVLHAFYKLQFSVNTPVLTFNIFTTAKFCWLMLRLIAFPEELLWDLGSPPFTQHSAGQAPVRKSVLKADTLLTSAPLFSFLELLAGWSRFLFFFPFSPFFSLLKAHGLSIFTNMLLLPSPKSVFLDLF